MVSIGMIKVKTIILNTHSLTDSLVGINYPPELQASGENVTSDDQMGNSSRVILNIGGRTYRLSDGRLNVCADNA